MGVDLLTNKRVFEIRRSIVRAFTTIKTRFRLELEREFYAPDTKVVPSSSIPFLERKAAAWYAVCYQDSQPGEPYTFCWIAWDILCKIANRVRGPMLEKALAAPGLREGKGGRVEDEEDFMDELDWKDIKEEPPHPPRITIVDHQGIRTVGSEVDDDMLKLALRF